LKRKQLESFPLEDFDGMQVNRVTLRIESLYLKLEMLEKA
jgi:hypothetical protein